jgi:hypothetical protein
MSMNPVKQHSPIRLTPEMALAIIDRLDERDFDEVAEAIKERARQRAYATMVKIRHAARKGGLRRLDFEDALRSVRARKKTLRKAGRS